MRVHREILDLLDTLEFDAHALDRKAKGKNGAGRQVLRARAKGIRHAVKEVRRFVR